jgi:hypothetical protein
MNSTTDNNRPYNPSMDEALLAHYDEIGSHSDYRRTLERMRAHGYEPSGPGAPLPGSPYYNKGNNNGRR